MSPMNEELKKIVQKHFGLPDPTAKKPASKPQLDPNNPQHTEILRRKAEYKSLSEIEKQEIQWRRKNISAELKKKADKIVAKLNGEPVSSALLSEEHDIFENYFHGALTKAGYIAKTQLGVPSLGLTWIYELPPPILCPHCKKEIPRELLKKAN